MNQTRFLSFQHQIKSMQSSTLCLLHTYFPVALTTTLITATNTTTTTTASTFTVHHNHPSHYHYRQTPFTYDSPSSPSLSLMCIPIDIFANTFEATHFKFSLNKKSVMLLIYYSNTRPRKQINIRNPNDPKLPSDSEAKIKTV